MGAGGVQKQSNAFFDPSVPPSLRSASIAQSALSFQPRPSPGGDSEVSHLLDHLTLTYTYIFPFKHMLGFAYISEHMVTFCGQSLDKQCKAEFTDPLASYAVTTYI